MANGNGINNGNGYILKNGNANGTSRNGLSASQSHLQSPLKSRSFWLNIAFYLFLSIFVISVLLYAFFLVQSWRYKQKINELDEKQAVYGTKEQKAAEKKALDYKKKIDDFVVIVNSHKISSAIFGFVESVTLPDVWFSNFDMSQSNSEIRLTGESNSMETFSRQVQAFEQSTDHVKSITVLSSQAEASNRITFIINLVLNPNIFNYKVEAPSSEPSVPAISSPPSLELQPYQSPDGDFSIRAPKGWLLSGVLQPGALATFSNVQADQEGANFFTATVQVASGPARGLGLDAYVANQNSALSKSLSNYALVTSEKLFAGSLPAYLTEITYTKSPPLASNLKMIQLVLIKNDKAYIVTGTVLKSAWEVHKDVLRLSLLAFLAN